MDWRREDTGYATAAVAVLGFVVYLIAANFGLVPSPLTPLLDGAQPAIAAIQAPPDVSTVEVTSPSPISPPASAVDRPSATKPPASAGVTDTAKPVVKISTPDGTSIALAAAARVDGTATDVGSGIDKVVVVFEAASDQHVVAADLACTGGKCTWTAKVPSAIATYSVTATAWDRAGNEGRSASMSLTVVNTGDSVEQVGNTVERAPGAVVGAVNGLLDGLGLRP